LFINNLDNRFNLLKDFDMSFDEEEQRVGSNWIRPKKNFRNQNLNNLETPNNNSIALQPMNKSLAADLKAHSRKFSKTFNIVDYSGINPDEFKNEKEDILTIKKNISSRFIKKDSESDEINVPTIAPESPQPRKRKLLRKISTINIEEFNRNIPPIKKRPLDFSLMEMVGIAVKFKQSTHLKIKGALYKIAVKKLNYYLDIFTHIKKMQEIDTLKFILLNKEQLNLFNFISKPSISITTNSNKELIMEELEKNYLAFPPSLEKMNELVDCYKALTLNPDDQICKKLLSVFNFEIENLLT
jgi:hypothetical protein